LRRHRPAACSDVTYAKKRKIMVSCASKSRICASSNTIKRMINGRINVMKSPVAQGVREKAGAFQAAR
jgi:hypothetical protein